MIEISESIQISATPTEVFRFCHNLERRPEWDERVDRIELQGLSRVLRRGALLRVDAHASRGLAYSWEGEYSQFSIPGGSTMRVIEAAHASYFRPGASEDWQFGPVGGGTRFTVAWRYKPRGLLGLLFDPLFRRGSIRRAIRRSMACAKALIEAG